MFYSEKLALDAAYIAGFIDGEGYIGISGYSTIVLSISNTYKPTLEWLHTMFGGHIHKDTSRPLLNKFRDKYYWQISGIKAMDVLILTLPYLREKKPQAELAIKLQQLKKYESCGCKGMPISERNKRISIIKQIKALKRVNHK